MFFIIKLPHISKANFKVEAKDSVLKIFFKYTSGCSDKISG